MRGSTTPYQSPCRQTLAQFYTVQLIWFSGTSKLLSTVYHSISDTSTRFCRLVKLVKSSDQILREAWKADVRLALARQEHQKTRAKEAGEEDTCPSLPLDGGVPLAMTLDAALNSSRELNDFVQTLPDSLQNPESEKTDDLRERRILQMMHNDLVETAALAILNNWVLFLRKAELPTSPPLNAASESAPLSTSDTSVVDQQLKRVGRICIEAAGQLLRTLRNQVTLFQRDSGFSIHMYSPTTVRRCFAAGVVLSRVAAICDESDVKACREGLVMAEELMRDMEKWLITHAGRDAEGSTGGSKDGSPLVTISLLRATVNFQTGNHYTKLRSGVKRSHTEMLEEVPENVNLKSLETLAVPFTDGKFFFCKLDGSMRTLAQTREPPAPQPVQESSVSTEGDPSSSSRPSTGERIRKVRVRRVPKVKVPHKPLKAESSASDDASPAARTPDRVAPQKQKDPPRFQPAVPIQPYPPSHNPGSSTAVVPPSPALNPQFSSGSAASLQSTSTSTDPPPEQVQAPAPGTSKPVSTPSIQVVGTHPPQAQVHETSDVPQYDPQPVVPAPPVIRRPAPPHPVQQPPTWLQSPVSIQYPPPTPQMPGFGYNGVPQYEAVQTIPYSSYRVPAQPSQPQPIPMHRMHQDSVVSWTMSGGLPPPPPPPSAFAQPLQSGHSNQAASYSQGALPPPTPSTYQHVPPSYPQMAGPSNQSVPGTDQQFYNVHPVNDPYYATRYPYQYS